MVTAISLFSGAGGFDLGFKQAGIEIIFANDINQDAVSTYESNICSQVICNDIRYLYIELKKYASADVLIGGPPCQGFSVAGKMNPEDERSLMVWEFAKAVEIIRPKIFAMENVKALGSLPKWGGIRREMISRFTRAGYSVGHIILNASDYGVPQSRERVIFIGLQNKLDAKPDLGAIFSKFTETAPTVRKALNVLDHAGTGNNNSLCRAKVTLAENPILRKSPYAGMLFNGLGRPVRIDGFCATLPASMGGNKTPIIDTDELYSGKKSWVEEYHGQLLAGKKPQSGLAPARLRRITVEEAAILQSFPIAFRFMGSQSSKYTQIGNAVPPALAKAVAKVVLWFLEEERYRGDYPKTNQAEQAELIHVY